MLKIFVTTIAFFQPDMFIAGTHLHRQGTYQTKYEPANKFNASFSVLFIGLNFTLPMTPSRRDAVQ